MRWVKASVIVIGLAALCSACSGGKDDFKVDTFSKADMCIVKVDDKKQVCYGDKQSDAEEILGAGTKGKILGIDYDFGVTVIYREDKVVNLALQDKSKGVYETARGAQIGDSKERFVQLYGDKYAMHSTEGNFDYSYDLRNKKYIGQITFDQIDLDNAINYFDFAAMFDTVDSTGAKIIMISDHRASMISE